MNKLQDWLGKIPARCALLLYLSVGLLQLWSIPAGLEEWLGLHWIAALVCAAVLAWIPALGQVLGLAASVDVLSVPVPLAALVFLWPVWLVGGVYLARRFTGGEVGTVSGWKAQDFNRALRMSRGSEEPPEVENRRPLQPM